MTTTPLTPREANAAMDAAELKRNRAIEAAKEQHASEALDIRIRCTHEWKQHDGRLAGIRSCTACGHCERITT